MSQWVKFSNEKPNANINTTVSGSKYLDLGKHLVRIDSVEGGATRNGIPFVKIVYVDEKGRMMTDRLYPVFERDGEIEQSFKYKSLAHAVLPEDGVKRFEFFTSNQGLLPSNPSLWTGLVGLFAQIEITKGRKGYTVEGTDTGYILVNIETGEPYTLMGGIPNEFENYGEAHECAKSQGLFRAWNEVSKFYASENPEHIELSVKVINELSESVATESL